MPNSEVGNPSSVESGSEVAVGSLHWQHNLCIKIASVGSKNELISLNNLISESDRYYCGDIPRGKEGVDMAYQKVSVASEQRKLQPGPQLGGIVKRDSKSVEYCSSVSPTGVCYMTQLKAIEYCKSQHEHLPSAKDLAKLSGDRVSETPKEGYHEIDVRNADGKPAIFYVSRASYQRPAGDLGNNWFWSSSVDSSYSDYAFVLNGGDGGDVVNGNRDYYNAVRCVRGR